MVACEYVVVEGQHVSYSHDSEGVLRIFIISTTQLLYALMLDMAVYIQSIICPCPH